jgi:hypothetical protein
MATTTPNYGWSVPTSSDYVAQGAVAIETLGDSVDASLFSITDGKNVGMVLLNTTTFSASASVTVDNVFSSTYDNYLVIFDCVAGTAQSLRFVYRDGTSDVITNYSYGSSYVNLSAGPTRLTGGQQALALFGAVGSIKTLHTQYINNVALAVPTNSNYQTATVYGTAPNGSEVEMTTGGLINTNSTAYEGFKYYVTSGTFAGTVRTYGIRNI